MIIFLDENVNVAAPNAIKPKIIEAGVESVFLKRYHKHSVNVCYTACSSLCTALFQCFFAWRPRESGDERAGVRFIGIIDQPKCSDENTKCRSRAPAYRDTHVRPRGQGWERERERKWADSSPPPTRYRPRICKRSFQLTATMARRIGRCAANSKPIRRVHARKSSTSSAPNTGRRTGLIPRDRAVRTDVYRGGYLRRNCAMGLTGLHFAQTNLCYKQYD